MRDCEGQIHPHARKGLMLFNEGRYFEAHEDLEIAWREETGKVREMYQGILEAGVTYLHIRRNNLAGALKVHSRSIRRLKDWPEVCRGTHVGQLRRDLDAIIAEGVRLGPSRMGELDPGLFRPILWEEV